MERAASWLEQAFGRERPFHELNHWLNTLLVPEAWCLALEESFGPKAGHYLATYVRDFIGGTILYYVAAAAFHVIVYNVFRERYYTSKGREDEIPTWETIRGQIVVAQGAIFFYAALPVFMSWLVEEGYTKCYFYIDEVGGWTNYLLNTLLYFTLVEFGIYWMHRTLHTNKFLFKYVHAKHHAYMEAKTLTPWASIAFNPLDGILQASPYVATLMVVPAHYITATLMLAFTAIWATNIHDAVPGTWGPIMGSEYHLIHHTHLRYNHGQIFVFMDYLFGTLITQKELDDLRAKKEKGKAAKATKAKARAKAA